MPTSSERTALYRLYDAEGRLLYIGIAVKPEQRWIQHAAEKDWWPEVARRDTYWCDSRAEALVREVDAIVTEQPIYNVHHNGTRRGIPANRHTRYRQMVDSIKAGVADGRYRPGEKLPSEKYLIEEYSFSLTTIRKALDTLRHEGVIASSQGAGVWVRLPEDRSIEVPIGRPKEAAEVLRRAISAQDLDELLTQLTQPGPDVDIGEVEPS
jgi:DNA-binding transcriptional regulator YhcF (GntR family)